MRQFRLTSETWILPTVVSLCSCVSVLALDSVVLIDSGLGEWTVVGTARVTSRLIELVLTACSTRVILRGEGLTRWSVKLWPRRGMCRVMGLATGLVWRSGGARGNGMVLWLYGVWCGGTNVTGGWMYGYGWLG